jgi:hypothetical protein
LFCSTRCEDADSGSIGSTPTSVIAGDLALSAFAVGEQEVHREETNIEKTKRFRGVSLRGEKWEAKRFPRG